MSLAGDRRRPVFGPEPGGRDSRRTRRLRRPNHPDLNAGWGRLGPEDPVGLRAIIPGRGVEDVGHEGLGVPVVAWEPGALDLDPDPLAAAEGIGLLVHV